MSTPLRELPPVGSIGRYEVLGRLAVGGMAEIFLAAESGPREVWRPVVVKRILPHVAEDEDYVESFVQEAGLSLRLNHPNVCAVYEFGEEAGRFYLAMEYVRGVRLGDLVDRASPLPIPLVARIVADVAAALQHAHLAEDERGEPLGIVHRDVTPDNVMVGFDGRVKLLDFGIAKAATQQKKTEAGVLKGKVAYMSPEQYQGERLDGRADLFSLGACFFEALTGQNPFERGAEAQTVAAILFEDTPSARALRPEIPEVLDDLLQGMLAKDPERRTRSAEFVVREIDAWLAGTGKQVRDGDVAAFLKATFPGAAEQTPELDRTPLEAPRRKPSAMDSAAFHAELDGLVEETQRAARRKRALVAVLAALLVLGAGGAVLWKVLTAAPPPG
ncbi:MAG TPA: serine/threonine-protein kinase [Polyangiaceae bacterium LLY-WYZ-15_(1-7)]|nr:serine/threonine-protein kinase [Polyangiaceae bacterium LLY-WYZ-15_(1-7)]HJL04677.1 serine/threonine-protein kinase [Polyangiaceae bacterium LLY-WYZ-15_(1-7)]HJL09678.1 serine/threonine-protein kinase [Polyangiaceae bacterium LLY-WYZ-15_(1-7)]HJL24154.1 serine/threonine-protein kinase [Polyangiaceae bacterium LLY-WYZ-15_(1-7)]HJL34071.1 serine/threonine-protein kinase [Polyangiaceae bacterium LLY-WYZ-15_(1-7)]